MIQRTHHEVRTPLPCYLGRLGWGEAEGAYMEESVLVPTLGQHKTVFRKQTRVEVVSLLRRTTNSQHLIHSQLDF